MPIYKLNIEQLADTVESIQRRIGDRFPGSGLARVSSELHTLVEKANSVSKTSPVISVFISAVRLFFVVAAITSLYWLFQATSKNEFAGSTAEFFQGLDATVNLLVIISVAVVFLFSIETKLRRARALKALEELRALAHVIDLHQLKKDPERLMRGTIITPSSPPLDLTAQQLARYLDYSSEMLSIIGKIAALYGVNVSDGVVLASVDAIESLTTNLSQKIWQKISITLSLYPHEEGGVALTPRR